MRVNSLGRVLSLGLWFVIAGVLGRPGLALAQQASVTLRGTVTDNAAAPQLGAAVTIDNVGTVLTDDRGEYQVSLAPGTYRVHVEASGFVTLDKEVTVKDAAARLDFQLVESSSEVIMIVGSRTPRSQLETSVPVDIITSDVLAESSHTETNQILNTLAPSFNATHLTVVDGTDHIDPASLRGLGPEHVLVLVNGRRLHQTSLVNVYNGGTVGVDLNAIPTSAIARIEVLRDGAASQYGSDAIAGVINIVLKDTVDVVDLYSMAGITASNDGMQWKLGGNTGFRLGDRGFVNVTGELFVRGRTSRAKPWPDDIFPDITGREATDAELERRGLTRQDFTMSVGQSGALVGTTFLNAGYQLSRDFELHGHAGYTYRQGKASGFYRLPSSENRVDLRVYPNGFLPEINPRMHAWTATAGVRGKKGSWDGDLSLTHGGDSFRFRVENSLNASLGLASPTEFDAGRLLFHQTSLNLDAVRAIDWSAFKALSVVMGAEARHENYRIDAGQPESYELGPEVNSMGEPKAPGSQVFPGFRPTDESNETRQSVAVYAGIESQPTSRTNLDVGGRFESYSDFGSTAIGKVAGRLAVLKSEHNEVAVRGAASTGFRAPGLQQMWYSTIATQFFNDPVTGNPSPLEFLISPNRSPVTEAFGVPRLKEETSVNFSGGFTARLLGSLSLSADLYRVAIKDRVVLSGVFDTADAILGDAITEIVDEFPGVAATQFYVNAVDTTTTGVDLVLDYTHRLSSGVLKTTAAANFTDTTVDQVSVPRSMEERFAAIAGGSARVREIFLGRYGRNLLEDLLPRVKGTLGLRYDLGGWSAGARANYFGPTEFHSDASVDGEYLDESFGSEVTFDLDLGRRVGGLWWSVGANNAFNNFPDEVKRPENRNSEAFLYTPAAFSGGAPYGTNGAFYYVRIEYKH
ncbi:MAG TPA: TonB-dependent receptor [Kofleriaceae bacterium]|nr:TonB-dependent receptor [Kofleriaceae bacterium]